MWLFVWELVYMTSGCRLITQKAVESVGWRCWEMVTPFILSYLLVLLSHQQWFTHSGPRTSYPNLRWQPNRQPTADAIANAVKKTCSVPITCRGTVTLNTTVNAMSASTVNWQQNRTTSSSHVAHVMAQQSAAHNKYRARRVLWQLSDRSVKCQTTSAVSWPYTLPGMWSRPAVARSSPRTRP